MNIQKIAIGVACLLCVQGMSAITTTRYNHLVKKFNTQMRAENPNFGKMQKYINELMTAKNQPDILHKAQDLQRQLGLKRTAWKAQDKLSEAQGKLSAAGESLEEFTKEVGGHFEEQLTDKDARIAGLEQRLAERDALIRDLQGQLEALKQSRIPSTEPEF